VPGLTRRSLQDRLRRLKSSAFSVHDQIEALGRVESSGSAVV
jgi:hypothetical protein